MTTSTRFPHHNQLVKENIIKVNLNAIFQNVYISFISYCIKIHKTPLLLNVTETRSWKRSCPQSTILAF